MVAGVAYHLRLVVKYRIREVAAWHDRTIAKTIHGFNRLAPETFPVLSDRHLANGYWWLVYGPDVEPVGFAGMVPFEPFPMIGYLKRAFVMPEHRGHGLQSALMAARETKARRLGWTHLVSECSADNTHSARNFAAAGFAQVEPEQRWGAENSIYWRKAL